jgi:uncharacterized integral membrane protein
MSGGAKLSEKELDAMDKAFKVAFIVGFILIFIVAILVTHNATTKPLTGWQVASVGIIAVILLVAAAVVYSQFPYSVLGKPAEQR